MYYEYRFLCYGHKLGQSHCLSMNKLKWRSVGIPLTICIDIPWNDRLGRQHKQKYLSKMLYFVISHFMSFYFIFKSQYKLFVAFSSHKFLFSNMCIHFVFKSVAHCFCLKILQYSDDSICKLRDVTCNPLTTVQHICDWSALHCCGGPKTAGYQFAITSSHH